MQSKPIRNVVQSLAGHSRAKGLSLESYLVMPLQRIPRYALLLKEIASKTPEGHQDCEELVKALQLVSETAQFCEEKKEDFVNIQKVQRIHQRVRIKVLLTLSCLSSSHILCGVAGEQ